MNPLTTLPRPLALLLISACLGIFAPAMAKENKQTAALQCEQNGELNPCPGDNTADMEKPAKDKSFKAQAEDGTTQTEKKTEKKKEKVVQEISQQKIQSQSICGRISAIGIFGGPGSLQAAVFGPQCVLAFHELGIERYAGHGTHLYALRCFVVPHTFGALGRVDFVNQRPHENGCIGAFRLAHIAVDAFIGDHQGHG